jgi:hypothetical protein
MTLKAFQDFYPDDVSHCFGINLPFSDAMADSLQAPVSMETSGL